MASHPISSIRIPGHWTKEMHIRRPGSDVIHQWQRGHFRLFDL
jgi:hypothetical protein